MKYRYHLEALEEFEEATRFYQDKAGLGHKFSKAIKAGIQRITENPLTWPIVEEGVRRYVVNRFPYCIYSTLEGQAIIILAIFHTK